MNSQTKSMSCRIFNQINIILFESEQILDLNPLWERNEMNKERERAQNVWE